ncbi:hypothetical protein [Actibacterium ureilyticum]|uniref:hypothetical protein n=1 Tax=Actibacterium ureilyticum TaxID=1590614 RepID=UPI000BAA98EC|nr:hypothetical protein [Actibacterium ureilyticum]
MSDPHFVFSSWQDLPDYFFTGYGFKDADFIVGPDGAAAYFNATGRRIGKDEDGCYAELVRTGDRIEINTDFRGNMRLFYYTDGHHWAVSNSWLKLAETLRANGVDLTPDRAQLAAWFTNHANFKQLTCFKTAIKEIRLLPVHGKIVVDRHTLSMRPVGIVNSRNYAESLAAYLNEWRNRASTLLTELPGNLSVDISGGLDSRAAIGFIKTSSEANADTVAERVTFGTSASIHLTKDAEVAGLITEYLKVPLRFCEPNSAPLLTTEEQIIRLWKLGSVGQYAPIALALPTRDVTKVTYGGNGGESLRGAYDATNIPDYVRSQHRSYAKHMPTDPRTWERDLEETLNDISAHYEDEARLFLNYFREFRSRFHAGSATLNRIDIQPLVAKSAHMCTLAMAPDKVRSKQILYDIMHNLDHGLLQIPFDEDHKTPTEQNLADLTTVPLDAPVIGKIYRGENTSDSMHVSATCTMRSAFAALAKQLQNNVDCIPAGLLSPEYLAEAMDTLNKVQDPQLQLNNRAKVPIHNVILLQEMAKLTDLTDVTSPFSGLRAHIGRIFARK